MSTYNASHSRRLGFPSAALTGLSAAAFVAALAVGVPAIAASSAQDVAATGHASISRAAESPRALRVAQGGGRMGRSGIGPMDGGPGGPGAFLGRMGQELGLSDDQKQRIRGILESARPEMQSVRTELRANREKLDALSPDDPSYGSVVSSVSKTAGDLTTRMVANGAQVQSQVWAVLTPEQRTKATALRSQMRERMQQRMKERRERRSAGAAPG
jgi:periplasmic protein CpxP/Spy